MVAAAKLRRAQEAATAARPYAERMDRVLANLGKRVTSRAGRLAAAGRHRQGRDAPAGRHDRRARPVRRLQLQHRPPRPRRRPAPARRRQDGQDPVRRPQGLRRSCGATTAARSSTGSISRASSRSAFANAHDIASKVLRAVRRRRVRRRHALFLRVQVGDRQKPTAQQLIPVKLPESTGANGAAESGGRLRVRARGERDPELPAAAQHRRPDLPRRCWRTPPPSRARA